MTKGRRGRPMGHRLSEESKRAIAASKKGQSHKQETKDKISRSLIIYFKQFNSLSDEIADKYCRLTDDEVCEWTNDVSEELDSSDEILTEKTMRNRRRMELCCGHNIELFSHSVTPETIVTLKELFDFHDGDIDAVLKDL